jgi:hypothetical protein
MLLSDNKQLILLTLVILDTLPLLTVILMAMFSNLVHVLMIYAAAPEQSCPCMIPGSCTTGGF